MDNISLRINKTHRLDDSCDIDCSIRDLHLSTRAVIKKYPQLIWNIQSFYATFLLKYLYLGNKESNLTIKIGGRGSYPSRCLEQVGFMNARLKSGKLYIPRNIEESSKREEIYEWNKNIFARILKDEDCNMQIPLLPIQVFWYINAGINLYGLEQSTPIWFGFDLLVDIALDTNIPEDLIPILGRNKNAAVRQALAVNPVCHGN